VGRELSFAEQVENLLEGSSPSVFTEAPQESIESIAQRMRSQLEREGCSYAKCAEWSDALVKALRAAGHDAKLAHGVFWIRERSEGYDLEDWCEHQWAMVDSTVVDITADQFNDKEHWDADTEFPPIIIGEMGTTRHGWADDEPAFFESIVEGIDEKARVEQEVMKRLQQWPKYSPEIWYNPEVRRLFVSPGDWEAPGGPNEEHPGESAYPAWETVEQRLLGIEGVDQVLVEPESGPSVEDGQGQWIKLDWKASDNPIIDLEQNPNAMDLGGGRGLDGPHNDSAYWGHSAYLARSESFKKLIERKLYHGTVIDNLDSIRSYGLEARFGDFVADAYGGDLEDAGIEGPEVTFAAQKDDFDHAINAMVHHTAKKLGKGFHDVTAEDIKRHGLIVKIPDESAYQQSDEEDWERPASVETGDWYSREDVYSEPDWAYFYGNKLITLIKRYGWGHSYLGVDKPPDPQMRLFPESFESMVEQSNRPRAARAYVDRSTGRLYGPDHEVIAGVGRPRQVYIGDDDTFEVPDDLTSALQTGSPEEFEQVISAIARAWDAWEDAEGYIIESLAEGTLTEQVAAVRNFLTPDNVVFDLGWHGWFHVYVVYPMDEMYWEYTDEWLAQSGMSREEWTSQPHDVEFGLSKSSGWRQTFPDFFWDVEPLNQQAQNTGPRYYRIRY